MKIEDIVVGETYYFNSTFRHLYFEIAPFDLCLVVGKDVEDQMVNCRVPNFNGVVRFSASFFDPIAKPVDFEKELRKKIAAEVLQMWPSKAGIAAFIKSGPIEPQKQYFKL